MVRVQGWFVRVRVQGSLGLGFKVRKGQGSRFVRVKVQGWLELGFKVG